jgi:hypothetical protein
MFRSILYLRYDAAMSHRHALFFLAFTILSTAQQKPVLVADGVAPSDWHSQTPTFVLTPAGPGARPGQVWVRKSPDGLLIAGHVDGAPPVFPAHAGELMTKEHLEIWLAVEPNPEMPVMGWGNQFGDIDLPNGELSCAAALKDVSGDDVDTELTENCQSWARKQRSYRIQLKRLFVRQWQLAPQVGVESFAAPAYRQIEQIFAGSKAEDAVSLPKELKPEGVPEMKVKLHSGSGYDFETLIPWKLFPPAKDPAVRQVTLMVEVFAPALAVRKSGVYSTTAPGRGYADFAAFSQIQFGRAKEYQISPCHYSATVPDAWGDGTHTAYFFPSQEELVRKTLALDNYRAGYAYEPAGLSPEVGSSEFFWKNVAPGEYLCGPPLRYYKGGAGTDLKSGFNGHKRQSALYIDKDDFDVHRLPGGPLLIRNGPRTTILTRFGTGTCGACPVGELAVYSLDQNLKLSELLNLSDVVGNELDDMDIQISPAWDRVGLYRHKQDAETWDDEFYCLKGTSYEKCGTAQTPPPEPLTLKMKE